MPLGSLPQLPRSMKSQCCPNPKQMTCNKRSGQKRRSFHLSRPGRHSVENIVYSNGHGNNFCHWRIIYGKRNLTWRFQDDGIQGIMHGCAFVGLKNALVSRDLEASISSITPCLYPMKKRTGMTNGNWQVRHWISKYPIGNIEVLNQTLLAVSKQRLFILAQRNL